MFYFFYTVISVACSGKTQTLMQLPASGVNLCQCVHMSTVLILTYFGFPFPTFSKPQRKILAVRSPFAFHGPKTSQIM